jgi:hypothetical protein
VLEWVGSLDQCKQQRWLEINEVERKEKDEDEVGPGVVSILFVVLLAESLVKCTLLSSCY